MCGVEFTMVGMVRDIVIPVVKGGGGGGEPVFTIVCEVVPYPVPAPSPLQEDNPPLTRLWKVY